MSPSPIHRLPTDPGVLPLGMTTAQPPVYRLAPSPTAASAPGPVTGGSPLPADLWLEVYTESYTPAYLFAYKAGFFSAASPLPLVTPGF